VPCSSRALRICSCIRTYVCVYVHWMYTRFDCVGFDRKQLESRSRTRFDPIDFDPSIDCEAPRKKASNFDPLIDCEAPPKKASDFDPLIDCKAPRKKAADRF
jgi:hypothetical protein